MQIRDLVKTIEESTDEELLERVRRMRRGREVERPVAAKKAERAEKKETVKKDKKTADILSKLTPEQIARILAKLSQ